MGMKWLGASLVLCGCSAGGFYMALGHKHAEYCLEQLLRALDHMLRELEFRSTALPELLGRGAGASRGAISSVLKAAGEALAQHSGENPGECFAQAVKGLSLPAEAAELLSILGDNLGIFDLQGQVQGMLNIREICKTKLEQLRAGREQRLRSYQTLGICAGAALAIILL